jgi:IclR family transcriptional regulator, pca regulon regulatory protein
LPAVPDRYFINSVQKGLACLNAFTGVTEGITLGELARRLNMTTATTWRLCHTLVVLGYVHRDGRKRYFLTPKVLTLGYSYLAALPNSHVIHNHLREMSDEINETVNLSILEDTDVIFLMRIAKKGYPLFDIRTGTRLPAYCTAMGKAILAFTAPATRAAVLGRSTFQPLTTKTIRHREQFERQLNDVVRCGYAVNDEELFIGNLAVAAPVLNARGRAVAAINIGVRTTEYSVERMIEAFAEVVVSHARAVSASLQAMMDPFHVGAPLMERQPPEAE